MIQGSEFIPSSDLDYSNLPADRVLRTNFLPGGIDVQRQVELPIVYREMRLEAGYRLDLVVENRVIVELKAVQEIKPIHEAQLLSYLKLSGMEIGLLSNFHVLRFKNGIKRLAN